MLLGEVISRLHTPDVRTLSLMSQDLIAQLFPEMSLSVGYIPSLITGHSSLTFAPTEYDARWRKRRIQGEVHDENACGVGGVAGHAGLFGTADALAQFGAMWCAHTVPNIAPELSREAIRLHAATDGERRGLGWMLRSLEKSTAGTKFGVNSYGHTGFVGNMLWIDPDQDLVICCLTNNVYYGRGKSGLFEFRTGFNDLIWEALCSS
jgi:CubicO group peptidase (beta-lactamase class C family)